MFGFLLSEAITFHYKPFQVTTQGWTEAEVGRLIFVVRKTVGYCIYSKKQCTSSRLLRRSCLIRDWD